MSARPRYSTYKKYKRIDNDETIKHRYEKFCDRLIKVSKNKDIDRALKEWVYVEEYEGYESCLCGYNSIKYITIYRNMYNNIDIKVGSICVNHFPNQDKLLPEDTTTFLKSGYNKDGFIVDDDDDIVYDTDYDENEESEEEEVDFETKYNESDEEDDIFSIEKILDVKSDKCLIKWCKTTTSIEKGVVFLQTYSNQVKCYQQKNNSSIIEWKDTWEPCTPELYKDYLQDNE